MKRQACHFLAAMIVIGLIPLATGCDEDGPTCAPIPGSGRIQGQVLAGGPVTNLEIRIDRVPEQSREVFTYRATPDESGEYEVEVPSGRYLVKLQVNYGGGDYVWAGGESSFGQLPPDTLLVDETHSHSGIDFLLGAVHLQMTVSEDLNGMRAWAQLRLQDEIDSGPGFAFGQSDYATIEDGQFDLTLAGVHPANYKMVLLLRFEGNNYEIYTWSEETFWFPATRDPELASEFTVIADSVVELESSLPTETAQVEGTIGGAWHELGLDSPPTFSLVATDSSCTLARGRAVGDGRFTVMLNLPQPFKMAMTQRGLTTWFGGRGFDDAQVLTPVAGETVTEINHRQCGLQFRIDPSQVISSGTEVSYYDPQTLELLGTGTLWTDGAQNGGLANLWPGEFLLYISQGGWRAGRTAWRPQWYDRAALPEDAQTIVLEQWGDIAVVDFVPELGGQILGMTLGASTAQNGFVVIVTPASELVTWGSSYTGSTDPEFAMAGLPDGDFRLGIFPREDYWYYTDPLPDQIFWYPGTTDWNEAAVITIVDAGIVTDVDITWPDQHTVD